MNVFIVDDHTLVREGIRWMLVNEPSIELVGEASTGSEFLEKLDDVDVDVVLLDIRMPTMSGLEVLVELAARPDPPKVLVLSMYDEPAMVKQAIVLGAAGYINKSAGRDDLVDAIHKVGRGEHYLPTDVAVALVSDFDAPSAAGSRRLTAEEAEILGLVAEGLGNREIAARLNRSETAVRNSLQEVFKRLDVHSRSEAVAVALRLGVLD